jgi:hypothetical protein
MKQFHLLTFAIAAILLTGCTVSQTTHSSYWHGNDSINTTKSYVYVEYGVIGRSQAVYYPSKLHKRNNGEVREGLVADAKADMRKQYLLGPNQAFANLSIDELTTITGAASSGGITGIEKVVIEIVISADVIEYVND